MIIAKGPTSNPCTHECKNSDVSYTNLGVGWGRIQPMAVTLCKGEDGSEETSAPEGNPESRCVVWALSSLPLGSTSSGKRDTGKSRGKKILSDAKKYTKEK